jgi:uncharacterized protein (DUF927 family)
MTTIWRSPMIKREWLPSSKLHPCFLCGNQSGWCSASATDDDTIVCKNTTTAPDSWKKLKDTTDGGGVFKPLNGEERPQTSRPKSTKTESDNQYQPTNHQTRDRVYRRLMMKNGYLSSAYRSELKRRGLSDEQIDSAIDRGWFANWQRGINSDFHSDTENIAGIDPKTNRTCSCDGLFITAIKDGWIVGGQIYPQPHVERKLGRSVNVPDDLGKYIWLSSSKHGGVNAHCFDTGENPLFWREHPEIQLEGVENLNQCEGALKSAVAALKFEERGQLDPWVGAAGGWFSENELRQCLNRYPNLKTVTLYPDAGSSHNPSILGHYHRATALIGTATGGKVKVLLAWWGQHTKEDRDVDELTTEDLDNLIIEAWENSIMGDATSTTIPESIDKRPHFTSSIEDGLVKVSFEKNKDGEDIKIREYIGNHLTAVAYINNLDRNGAALHLEFKTIRADIHHWTMPRADLAGEGTAIVGGLLSRDYAFNRKQKNLLLDYLHGLGSKVKNTYTVTDSSGWVGKSFVLPHKTYGDETLKFRDVEPSPDAITELKGTLEGWKDNVAAKCARNSRLIFGLGTSFAAPLLPIVNIESGGFHLVGISSQGKTTILSVAASVTGIKDIPHWRTTTNGLESTATAFNHLCLPLDEIHQADAKDVGNIAYMLANGQGKARMKKDLTNRKPKTWQLMVLSSGEVSLGNYMKTANITQKGGQEVRLPDVPAMPVNAEYGCFETIHGADTAVQFISTLEAAVKEHHGTALDAFLARLVVDCQDPKFAGNLSKQVHEVAAKLCEGTKDNAVGRVAKRFALLQVVLGLAHKYELLPFPVEDIEWSVGLCFQDWLAARGGDGSIEIKQAIDRIEYLLVTNEFSDRVYDFRDGDNKTIRNLLAYRKVGLEGYTEEFWVPPSIFDNEFCNGVNKSELVKKLQQLGWLLPPRKDGKSRHQRTVNNKVIYCYVFKKWKNKGEGGEEGEGSFSNP